MMKGTALQRYSNNPHDLLRLDRSEIGCKVNRLCGPADRNLVQFLVAGDVQEHRRSSAAASLPNIFSKRPSAWRHRRRDFAASIGLLRQFDVALAPIEIRQAEQHQIVAFQRLRLCRASTDP